MARLGLLPYTPTSWMLVIGLDPPTPGRLLITFAATQRPVNLIFKRTYFSKIKLTIGALDVEIEEALARVVEAIHANA